MMKLTKKLLALGLCLTMIFSLGMVQVSADEYIPQEAWRLVDPAADGKIRLYAEPDVDSELLKTFWNETSVIVLEKDDMTGWIKIRIDEYEGFIHSEPKAVEVEVAEIPEVTEEEPEVITEEIQNVITEVAEAETELVPTEEIPEEIIEVIEEEPGVPAEEIPEEISEVVEEKTEAPTEEITDEIVEVMEEETEVPTEEIPEEIIEVAKKETEAPAEEIPEEIIEVTEEIEAPVVEITEEIVEVTEEETEAPAEEIPEEKIGEEITEAIDGIVEWIAEEETKVYSEETPEEIIDVADDKSQEFEGTEEETGEFIQDENESKGESEEKTGEFFEESIQISIPPTVEIWWDAREIMDPGEPVTLYSEVIGGEGYIITYQWQCDSGNGYEDIEGANESTYTFPASAELLSCRWRLWFDYDMISAE